MFLGKSTKRMHDGVPLLCFQNTFLQLITNGFFHLLNEIMSHSCERIEMYSQIYALNVCVQTVSRKKGHKIQLYAVPSVNCCAKEKDNK